MIQPAERPLDPDCREVRALHVALNSPVVRIDSLPVGPAAAAVALHVEAGATLAVRSVRSGHVVFFTSAEGLRDSPEMALDAVLSFGEQMGFLFDDDEVAGNGPGGPRQAARLWRELLGDSLDDLEPAEAGGSDAPSSARAVESQRSEAPRGEDEILLDQVASHAAALAAAALRLSKFRWAASRDGTALSSPAQSRRRGGGE